MILVVGVTVILFLLTTTLLVVSGYLTTATQAEESRLKSVHIADAGLNAYLYELRRDPLYYVGHPVLGPTDQDDGRWIVRATAPDPHSQTPLTLRAEGRLVGSSVSSVTVVATVRFPTFADYMFLSDADINVGADATITGKVRSNGSIDNKGEITGETYAVGNITGSGEFGTALPAGSQTKFPNSTSIDFGQVSADTDSIRVAAQAAGSYYPTSNKQGYRITFNHANYTIERVTGGVSTDDLTVEPVAGGTNVPIPSVGVIYVLDDVWVGGTYSTPVTVCSSRDIYPLWTFVPDTMNSKVTAGLVAYRNIVVPTANKKTPEDFVLTAALLAQTGSVYGDLGKNKIRNHMTINGSSAYHTYGYFAQYSGNTVIRGWLTRTYTYDPRLDLYPPPRFPVVHEGSLKVNTWMEQ